MALRNWIPALVIWPLLSCNNKEMEDRISRLEQENSSLRSENYRLQQALGEYNAVVTRQQEEIAAVKEDAQDYVDKLSEADSIKQEQDKVYYLVASKYDLINRYNLITEDEGGNFIVKAANINYSDFNIYSTAVRKFPVAETIRHLFPVRNNSCFTVESDGLQIEDPECFWSAYKYCIIMTE